MWGSKRELGSKKIIRMWCNKVEQDFKNMSESETEMGKSMVRC